MWVLQMYLAKKQATGFLDAVNSIKGPGLEVAIGVNQPKWGRKKIYLAISANDEGIIVDEEVISNEENLIEEVPISNKDYEKINKW